MLRRTIVIHEAWIRRLQASTGRAGDLGQIVAVSAIAMAYRDYEDFRLLNERIRSEDAPLLAPARSVAHAPILRIVGPPSEYMNALESGRGPDTAVLPVLP
jgi:hypothetical protein